MISSHTTWATMSINSTQKEIQDSLWSIILMGLDTGDQAWSAINEAMNYNFIVDKALA
jgi:hypothetical protein